MKALFACVVFVCSVCGQQAQRAGLAGHILDPSGATVSGAAVQVRNAATGETTVVTSDQQGVFIAAPLPPGAYILTAKTEGFTEFERRGVIVKPGRTARVYVVLSLAGVSEQVTVTEKAPDFVEALEGREVRESAARDAGEALADVDGIWKIRKGGVANDVVLRGFQQGNINVLVDGTRIYGACPNHMDPPAFHVDFAEIQQVEIVKGAFDIRNQGSLGGAVNIISKEPFRGLRITPGIAAGSWGYFNPSMTASVSNEKVYALAGYSSRRSGVFRDGAGKRFTEYANYTDTARDKTAFDVNTGWFKLGAAPAGNHRFELGYTRQQGGDVLYPYLLMDALYDNADRLTAGYNIGELSGALKQLRIQSYFTRVKHWMTDEDRISAEGAPRPYSMATFAATKALGGRVEADFGPLVTGFEGYRRNWKSVNTMRMSGMYIDQPSIPNVDTSVAGLYAQYEKTWRGLRASAGARLDTGRTEARSAALNTDLFWAYKGTRSLSHRDTNPSGNVRLRYPLPAGLELFAGIGRAVRLPDPQERYFALKRAGSDWVGNPGLRPTHNTEADFGLNYRSRRVTLRPTVYYSRLANFITMHNQPKINPVPFVMNAAARSYENVDARIYGGELAYTVAVSRTLVLLGGMSWARGTKETLPAYRIFDRNLAEMPPLKSRTALRYGTRRFFGEVETIAVNAQGRVDVDLRELRTPGYAVVNVKAGVHTAKLNVAAGLDNLTNRFYYEHFSYQRDAFRSGTRVPEPGRGIYLTVSYGF